MYFRSSLSSNYNSRHPLAQGVLFATRFYATLKAKNFVTGEIGLPSQGGSVNPVNMIGPAYTPGTTSAFIQYTVGVPAVPNNMTFLTILSPGAGTGQNQFILQNSFGGNGTNGMRIYRDNATLNLAFNKANQTVVISNISLAQSGIGFAIAVSARPDTTVNFVAKNLSTGKIQLNQQADTQLVNPPNQFFTVGGSPGDVNSSWSGSIAAAAIIKQFFPISELLNWLQNPFSFWELDHNVQSQRYTPLIPFTPAPVAISRVNPSIFIIT